MEGSQAHSQVLSQVFSTPLGTILDSCRPECSVKDLVRVQFNLVQAGITNTEELIGSLLAGDINERLRCADLPLLNSTWLAALARYLGMEFASRGPCTAPNSSGPVVSAKAAAGVTVDGLGQEEPAAVPEEATEPAVFLEPAHHESPTSQTPPHAQEQEPEQPTVPADLQQRALTFGVHFFQLDYDSYEQLAELLDRLDCVQMSTAEELQTQYAQMGYAIAEDEVMQHAEIATKLREAIVWQEMKLEHLQTVCFAKGWFVERGQSREEVLKLLPILTWESAGIPVTKLPSLDVARRLLSRFRSVEASNLRRLHGECQRLGLRTSSSLKLVASQLKQAYTWQELPAHELRRVCAAHSISLRDTTGEPAHEALWGLLMDCLRGDRSEIRGISAERLGSIHLADELLAKVDEFQLMHPSRLKAECEKMGVPVRTDPDAQDMVDLLRDLMILGELPLRKLQLECCQHGVRPNGDRDAICRILCMRLDYKMKLKEQNQQPLDSAAAMKVLERQEAIERMSLKDLFDLYAGTGYPQDRTMSKEDMVQLMKLNVFWDALPLFALIEEANRVCKTFPQLSPDDEMRKSLVTQLKQHQCMNTWKDRFQAQRIGDFESVSSVVRRYNALKDMSPENLERAWLCRGIPPMASVNPATMLDILRVLLSCEVLPLVELRKCLNRDGEIQCNLVKKGNEEEERSSVIQWLTVEKLIDEYRELGMPADHIGHLEVYGLGKKLADTILDEKYRDKTQVWRRLSVEDLYKKLQKHGLKDECRVQMLRTLHADRWLALQ